MKLARVAATAASIALVSGVALATSGASVGATTPSVYSSGNTALPPATACGPTIRKTNGTPWRCTFVDNFNGTSLNRKVWVPQLGFYRGDFSSGYNCFIDSPQTVSVSSSALHLRIVAAPIGTYCGAPTLGSAKYVGGMVSTYRLFSQRYGRFQARIKVQASNVPGLHDAFWLWPDDRYSTPVAPATGEIDVSETFSMFHKVSVAFLHYGGANTPWVNGVNTAWYCQAARGVWNTYTLSWSPKSLTIQINGRTCLVNRSGSEKLKQRYIINLTTALGEDKNKMVAGTPIPATMLVDYVKVWL